MATQATPEPVYRVLAGPIKAADGTWCFQGTILRASQIGGAATVAKLLEAGAIEEVPHGTD